METAYRQVEWTWEQWAGYRDTETQSKIVDVPYRRYPRTFVPPPSIELTVIKNKQGRKYITAPRQVLDFNNIEKLLNSINILLEIFGYCEILSESYDEYLVGNLKRLNWKILPPGKWPWKRVKKEV